MMTRRATVTDQPLDVRTLLDDAAAPSDGAVLVFLGVVRAENEGRAVSSLEYEAYAEMALREMERIADEARERFCTGEVRLAHRVGRLGVGEASVAVVVAAPHRGEAYAASRYAIDEVKRRVPVWKREGYVDGEQAWVAGFTPAAAPV